MKTDKQKKLEAAGWNVGSTSDFLGLGDTEEKLINMKLALAHKVKELRQSQNITQVELARRLKSSQSRVAKLENVDGSVSLELLIKALFGLGASQEQIGQTLTLKTKRKPLSSRRKQIAQA